MTTNTAYYTIDPNCRGSHPACRAARRAGRLVHIVPGWRVWDDAFSSIILPDYHFETAEDAVEFLDFAIETAPVVTCDEDLYDFRARKIAHKTPMGWVDPSRRRGA
jgi:hypothetical protein